MEVQITNAKTKCGRLVQKFRGLDWIHDDESYFTLSNFTIHGNDGYYTSDPKTTPPNVKFAKKKKFETKVLVWIAVGPNGVSYLVIWASNK